MKSKDILKMSAIMLALFGTSSAMAVDKLKTYNADPSLVSVSGLSSGGFMAVQLGVAYSGTFTKGFGVFAGGPFDCTRNAGYTTCMYNGTPAITTPEANMTSWSGSQIDSLTNLASRKFYGWYGGQDYTVGANPMNQLKTEVQAKGITTANTSWNTTSSAGHTFPTNFAGSGDNACGTTGSPYVSNCAYDGAGAVLQWMYGTLTAPNAGTLGGTLINFDQTEFNGGPGMDTSGYVYVPAACASGTVCKVHVSLHGCVQSHNNIGMSYINNTYYNNWADTNNMIIVWPQAIPDNTSRATTDNGSLANSNGCWDWLGWYGNNFDQKGGTQMAAIVAMVNRITSGFSVSIPTTPTGLAVGAVTNTTVALNWTATSGATSYTVYRGGVSVGTPTGNAYTDTGLTANTLYSYTVSASNSKGASAQSTSVNATTTNAVVPAQVTGLTVGTITATSVALSWSTVTGATSYDIYRNGSSQPIGNTTGLTYTDTGVTAGNSYTYNVAAENANGVGAQSAAVNASTPATGYSATSTDTVTNQYIAGHLNVNQYNYMGAKYGYNTVITMYNCSGTWTNQSNCGPLQ
ncbi:MAG TPA: fibronectin type III domain-containing protein [Burkholderiaceae bacterium]|jgi:poly(3-hydroxybutyrate) depolymerase